MSKNQTQFQETAQQFQIQEAFYEHRGDDSQLQQASESHARAFWESIFEICPSLKGEVMFCDVVFILPTKQGLVSRGYVAAWKDGVCAEYSRCVKKLLKEAKGVAGHPVFQAGLPYLPDKLLSTALTQPSSANELRSLLEIPNLLSDSVRGRAIEIDFKCPPSEPKECSSEEPSSDISHLPQYLLSWNLPNENKQYGDDHVGIEENFSFLANLVHVNLDGFKTPSGKPLMWFTGIPVCWWGRNTDEGQLSYLPGGSCLLGTSRKLTKPEISMIRGALSNTIGSGFMAREAGRHSMRKERVSFAHQISAVVDSIVASVERLAPETRDSMGGHLLAKLHLVRATINSYRSKGSRVDAGEFPYAWDKQENPLSVYRDIGIQLGFARALEARADEPKVRDAGKMALRPDYQVGQRGFDRYRDFFAELPDPGPMTLGHLKHSNFAVLILLVLKQAVYHTIRARIYTDPNAKIVLSVVRCTDGIIFECIVRNPKVNDDDAVHQSKDEIELRELAERLSHIPDHPASYTVEGPTFNETENLWCTTTRIHAKSSSPP